MLKNVESFKIVSSDEFYSGHLFLNFFRVY